MSIQIDKRKTIFGLATLLPLIIAENAQARTLTQGFDLNSILNAATKYKNNTTTNSGLPTGVTSAQANSGIKEALANGAAAAVLRLGKSGGYWNDGKVRIPLPQPLNRIQSNLKPLGLSSSLDDLQLKMNRAAEAAAPKAKTIFVDAIKNLSIDDVVGVVRGGDTAGTDLLKLRTKDLLLREFRPPMQNAVNSTGAARAFSGVNSKYGSQISALGGLGLLGGSSNLIGESTNSSDLTSQFVDFACSKALDGMFYYIGQEETAIRKDPIKQTSSLLKKVFGN